MAIKYILPFAVSFLLAISYASGLQTVNGRIKITIGTTSACGDTVRFIGTDLKEAYDKYGDFLDIEFVPWGRTVRLEDGSLRCQFGENDCWANRVHRCVLNMLRGDQARQVHYMICEFTAPYPAFSGNYQCANALQLSLIDLDYCVAHSGDELDLAAEAQGSQLTQAINFIPSIVFNDQINTDLHWQALTRLTSMICFALAADQTTGVTSCEV